MSGRIFSKEFKEQAVLLTQTSGKKVGEIASDLGIRENMLWRWKKELREAGEHSFPGQGHRQPGTDLEEEVRRLNQELLDVKMERDILKKAVASRPKDVPFPNLRNEIWGYPRGC